MRTNADGMPAPTVIMHGFNDNDAIRGLRDLVAGLVLSIGQTLDLTGLDGVTVAMNYDDALAGFDRGDPALPKLGRTNTKELVGVGVSFIVRRGSEARTHILVDGEKVFPLVDDGAGPRSVELAKKLLAHECGHVEENGIRERQFPGTLLAQAPDQFVPKQKLLCAEVLWEEYAVNRATAGFSLGETGAMRSRVDDALAAAQPAAIEAYLRYGEHRNVERLFQEVGAAAVMPLKMAAYYFGQVDGLQDLGHRVDDRRFSANFVFTGALGALRAEQRKLWEIRGRWPDQHAFLPLGDIALATISNFGVTATPQPAGNAWIGVKPPVWLFR